MATRRFHLTTSGAGALGGLQTSETSPGASGNRPEGWTVAKVAAARYASVQQNTKRASSSFTTTAVPGAALNDTLKDWIEIDPGADGGTFDAGQWTCFIRFRTVTTASQSGRARYRIFKGSSAAGATEISSGATQGSIITPTSGSFFVSDAFITLPAITVAAGELIFVALAWEITTAATSNSADIIVCYALDNSYIETTNWTAAAAANKINSSLGMGMSGSITIQNPLTIGSSKLIPVGGAVGIQNPVVLNSSQLIVPGGSIQIGAPPAIIDSSQQIPVTAAGTITHPDVIDSSVAIPVTGAASISHPDTIDSSKQIPVTGAATLSHPDTIDSSQQIPVTASGAISVGNVINSSQQIPVTPSATIAVGNTINSSRQIPVGAAGAIAVGSVIASTVQIPIGGGATIALALVIDSSKQIPLTGTADISVTTPAADRIIDSAVQIPVTGAIDMSHPVLIDSLVLIPMSGIIVIQNEIVVPPVDTGNQGIGGGGGRVSAKRRAAWMKALATSIRTEEKVRPRTAPTQRTEAKRERPLVTIERAIRALRLPQYVKEELIEELQKPEALPFLRAIATLSGIRTTSDLGSVSVETGSTAYLVPIITQVSLGDVLASGIQNPTDEELIQLLFTS